VHLLPDRLTRLRTLPVLLPTPLPLPASGQPVDRQKGQSGSRSTNRITLVSNAAFTPANVFDKCVGASGELGEGLIRPKTRAAIYRGAKK